jgi:hypothetical protein
MNDFIEAWKRLEVRPPGRSDHPERTRRAAFWPASGLVVPGPLGAKLGAISADTKRRPWTPGEPKPNGTWA